MNRDRNEYRERLWTPPAERVASSLVDAFRRLVESRHGVSLAETRALHRWTVEHPEDFWRLAAEDAGIRFATPPNAVIEGEDISSVRWFPGATLSYAEHCLHGGAREAPAIIAVDETGRERRWTFEELERDVRRVAAALVATGVGPNDTVAAYTTNSGEAVIALLATATIGAVYTSCSPGFGVQATLDRFQQVRPKVLFGSNMYFNNGKRFDIADRLRAIASQLDSVERVVLLPDEREMSGPGIVRWEDFLATGRATVDPDPRPFDHPLYVLYSSGTTGAPKGIVHRAGGALLKHAVELRLHCDVRPGDVVLYYTSCGWMMWNWLVSALAVGATIVLYEGGLVYPSRDALWRLIDRYRVTHFGTSAPYIESCNRKGFRPRTESELATLRCVMSTGAPLTPAGFRWVYDAVKRDVHLASISGGTDIVGCFMLGDPTRPVYAGQLQGPALGADIAVFDDDGRPVEGPAGELVCRSPLPSMPLGFWNDPTRAKLKATYFERFPGAWHHGDWIAATDEGGYVVFGRSDATLKPGGVRIGTAEIYRPLGSLSFVVEAVAVGKRRLDGDVHIWLFVVLEQGCTLDAKTRESIESVIRAQATPRHVPHRIVQLRELPRTRNGKLVELAVARAVNGDPVPNVSSFENPEAFEELLEILADIPPSTR